MTQFTRILFLTTALIAVAACSSNNTPTPIATDTPVLPPSTPAPPAGTQYTMATIPTGTALSLTAHTGLEAFNLTNGASAAAESQVPAGSLVASPTSSYVTTANGFTLTLPDGKAATFTTAAGSTQLVGSLLFPVGSVQANGSQRFQSTVAGGTNNVVVSLNNAQNTNLAYATYGTWAEYTALNNPITAGTLATGVNSTLAQMPTSGTATYTGHLTGYAISPTVGTNITDGAVSLNANFSSNSLTGSITGITTEHGGMTPITGVMNDINLTGGSISGTAFTGSASVVAAVAATTVNVAGANGTFGGKFYGPGAAEAAGSLTLTGNGSTVIGAFGAKKP